MILCQHLGRRGSYVGYEKTSETHTRLSLRFVLVAYPSHDRTQVPSGTLVEEGSTLPSLAPPAPIRRSKEPKNTLRRGKEILEPEEEANREYALMLGMSGEVSLHPSYPEDRLYMDYYNLAFAHPSLRYSSSIFFFFLTRRRKCVELLPPKAPAPYGKPLTVIIDASLLWNRYGKRPGLDIFLSRVYEKYEIILYGDQVCLIFNIFAFPLS